MENTATITTKKEGKFEKRIHEIDFIRGVLVILICIDHFFWFSEYFCSIIGYQTHIQFFLGLYDVAAFYESNGARAIIREICLFGIIFCSGISCAFSKNNWKRAGKLLFLALLFYIGSTLLTALTGENLTIEFNILSVLAWSVLIYCFIQNKSWKMSVAFALISMLILIVGIYGLTTTGITDTSSSNYTSIPALWIPRACADWMPFFPYSMYFFLGAAVSKVLYPNRVSLTKKRYDFERPICFAGRYSLWFYLGAIPVYCIIYVIIGLCLGVSFF